MLSLRLESTQKKLVKVKNLSLETAIETAKIDETASRDTEELQNSHGEASASVYKLYSQQQPQQNREIEPRRNCICYRCNGRGHRSDDCRFRDEICHGCGKPGHVKAVCRFGYKNKHYNKAKRGTKCQLPMMTVAMVVMTTSGAMGYTP